MVMYSFWKEGTTVLNDLRDKSEVVVNPRNFHLAGTFDNNII